MMIAPVPVASSDRPFEDAAFHPCVCIGVDGPRTTDPRMSGARLLSPEEARDWRMKGLDVVAAQWFQ